MILMLIMRIFQILLGETSELLTCDHFLFKAGFFWLNGDIIIAIVSQNLMDKEII